MDNEIKQLQKEFIRIQKMGWIVSKRVGSTGIGKTFEDLIGKKEDKNYLPDYQGIEIKTKRNYSNSYTTLFNLTPNGPDGKETERLRNIYGYPDRLLKSYKVLNNSVYANIRTWIGTKFLFQLQISMSEEKIYLLIFDCIGNLIEKRCYWSFKDIIERLNSKIKIIAFIEAKKKTVNGIEYFKYISITFYKFKGFKEFINLINNGLIRVTFKISLFKKGSRFGELHDHGTGFDIRKKDFSKLFDEIE